MTDFWNVLAIAPTDDVKLIKRAYAARLKHVRPDDDPLGFQQLREAYEWALEYGVRWFAYEQEAQEGEQDDQDEAAQEDLAPESGDPSDAPEPQLTQRASTVEPHALPADAALDPQVIAFVPSYRRKQEIDSASPPMLQAPDPVGAPEIAFEPKPFAAMPTATQTVRVSSEFLPELRSIDEFLASFYQRGQQMQAQEQAEQWLEAQPEWISLPFRRHLDAALERSFAQMLWPWPAVLAVSNLLEWEGIGAGRRDLTMVRRARLHARASLTLKPTLFSFFSKSATAYVLLRPPKRWWRLVRPLLPVSHWVNQLFSEVQAEAFAPDEIFDVSQVNIEQNLQSKVLNGTNFARIVADAMFIIVVVQLLGGYKGSDNSLLVLGLIIFMGLFAFYSLIRVIASLRLMRQSYFRWLWNRSLRAGVLPPGCLLLPVLFGLGFAATNLQQPMLPILGATAILHCMRAPLRFIWLPIAGTAAVLMVAGPYFWPSANQVLHALSALAIGGYCAAIYAWYRVRKLGVVAHMHVDFAPVLVAGSADQEAKPRNVSWLFWIIAFLILRAITSMG